MNLTKSNVLKLFKTSYSKCIKKSSEKTRSIGDKAVHLQNLSKLGFNVPTFFVFSKKTLTELKSSESIFNIVNNAFIGAGKELPDKVAIRLSGTFDTSKLVKASTEVDTTPESLTKNVLMMVREVNSKKIKDYLKENNVDDFNYSIIVQEMVYGDKDEFSCKGMLVTTNPSRKANEYFSELKFKKPVAETINLEELELRNPMVKHRLDNLVWEVKKQYKCDQHIKFVIDNPIIYILSTSTYK